MIIEFYKSSDGPWKEDCECVFVKRVDWPQAPRAGDVVVFGQIDLRVVNVVWTIEDKRPGSPLRVEVATEPLDCAAADTEA